MGIGAAVLGDRRVKPSLARFAGAKLKRLEARRPAQQVEKASG
jgi:hypothetical protein